MVDVGLMMESEKKIFEMMNKKAAMSKYWMPLVWATNIINRARKEALITSDHVVQTLLVELSDIRKRLGALIGYDTVCVPLVYTQVVTLSLYAYFFSALLGRQFVEHSNGTGKYEEPDMYFPFFTALQFCFYIGWLKVAEVLINPFGEDDDDIELNWLIDRHIKAGYMIVDEMHEEHPELLKDQYWDDVVPKDLPYTVASEQYRKEEPKGSAEHYKVKDSDALYANVMLGTQIHNHGQHRKTHQDDMYADYESVDTPLVERKKNGWFQRQITRVGSVRSSSTTYSSGGGFFSRNRHNSVYSSPETGGLPQTNNPNLKISLYDRLVGRKSVRSQRMGRQGTMTKLNSVPVSLKNRPRIPTPDVTKEVIDREQRLALSATNAANIGAGVVGVIPANGHYPDLSVVVLSPIQETESTPSSGKSGAAALAQAVLSPTLTSAGLMTPVTLTPVTMGHLTQLGLMTTATTTTPHINQGNSIQATLTEVTSSEEEGSGSGSSRSGSITGQEDRSTPLIDNNNSPMGSNGSSPIFDGYNDRSPILMRPEKLGYVVTAAVPGILANRAMAIDARGRRSASLPSPPVPLAQPGRDDRSVSLPQSPGLQPREIRMTSVSSKQDDLTVERSATVSSNQGIRSRTSSFGHDLSKSNQRVQDATRKISSASNASGSLGTTSSTSSTSVTMTVANSKRDEVYV